MATVQKIRCQVERITNYGGGVYTVDLIPSERLPRFRAGQFLHLALDNYDPAGFWPDSRVFSIASSPTQRDRLQIAYSVQGRFTARMERELAESNHVWIKLPYGQFVIDDSRDIVLCAGGTGVTAFTAFIAGLQPGYAHSVQLFYGARHTGLLIYRDLIQQAAQRVSNLQAQYYVESASEHGKLPDIHNGRLSIATIWANVSNPLAADYYLSGPPIMLKIFTHDLLERGVNSERIRIDAWE